MTKRMLNREEVSLTQRNVDRHKRDVKIIKYKIEQEEMKILNWETVIKPKLEQDIDKRKELIIKQANGVIEGVESATPYHTYLVEQNQFMLDNWEHEEFELKRQIIAQKGNIDNNIKQYKNLLKQINEVIIVSEDQIKNGVDIKEPTQEEENKDGK